MANLFQTKICGITRPEDAVAAASAGVDAIGLNFYSDSPRYVTLDEAARILKVLPKDVIRVGVFVNATDDEVCQAYDHLQLDAIQLHGDELPEFVRRLGERAVIRAFRLGPDGMAPVVPYLAECAALGGTPEMVLIDGYQAGEYGGTGVRPDWQTLVDERDALGGIPLILAGGLKAENVGEAIAAVTPAAVDTASGVESEPGLKDPQRMQRFVDEARAAFFAG